MAILLDSGILLRLANTQDQLHEAVSRAVDALQQRGEALFMTTQNVAEFLNVCTRPVTNNGLGIQLDAAIDSLERVVEPTWAWLPEHSDVCQHFKKLGRKYGFGGKQVHDVRLVAMMLSWNVDEILTLNARHFQGFAAEGIRVRTIDEFQNAS